MSRHNFCKKFDIIRLVPRDGGRAVKHYTQPYVLITKGRNNVKQSKNDKK